MGENKMKKYICNNKRCKNEFYSNEDKTIILCPCCNQEILNLDKVVNTDNFLWIESMFENLQHYGKEGTFNMIDKCYINPLTRSRIRQIYFDTLKILEK
jgi:hypothetical protein